jgi:hypothetical protein
MSPTDQGAGAKAVKSALAINGGVVDRQKDHPGHLANVPVRSTVKL